ncbi:MAG: methyltransferase domain-containing protein [Verrucomicrobiota bacterium]|jgi:2-polyprenyl-3-methyl-5-hydroxy-6-metoxy-1,4-benzoquinol methylase
MAMDARLAEVKRLFEKPEWYLSGRTYHVRVRMDVVRDFLKDTEFNSILDIGCGDGSISLPLLTPARRLTLLDMSDAMLDIARSRVPSELSAAVKTASGDFMQAGFDTHSYDLVICLGVLAYVDSPKPLIEKLLSILKPGGKLIVECSDRSHFMSRLARGYDRARNIFAKPKFRPAAHSANAIVAMFRGAGFQLEAEYRYCAPIRVMRKLFSQGFHYQMICAVHGKAASNRMWWLGNECIFYFRKTLKKTETKSGFESNGG